MPARPGPTPSPKRRLLDRVARELRVPEDQAGGRVQSREARADEQTEGLMIALAGPFDECLLIHGALPSARRVLRSQILTGTGLPSVPGMHQGCCTANARTNRDAPSRVATRGGHVLD